MPFSKIKLASSQKRLSIADHEMLISLSFPEALPKQFLLVVVLLCQDRITFNESFLMSGLMEIYHYDLAKKGVLHLRRRVFSFVVRRTSQLSISALEELVKGEDGELAVGREIVNPGKQPGGGCLFYSPVFLCIRLSLK